MAVWKIMATFAVDYLNIHFNHKKNMKKVNAILYDVFPTPNPDETHEQLYYPRAVTYGQQMNDKELKEYLEKNTRINSSQFVGMIEALVQEIPQQLLQNKSVHIRGMGTFFLKIGVRSRKDANGHVYVQKFTDPDAITARDLCIEGIGFRADPTWSHKVTKSVQHFERVKTRHQTPVQKSKLLLYINKMVSEKGFVTVKDVECDQNTTNYHARKLLEGLCTGKQPKLYKEMVGHAYIYKRFSD